MPHVNQERTVYFSSVLFVGDKYGEMDKTKIMVVEGEGIVAHDIARQLKDMGYDVVAIVYSGEAAVEKAKEVHPDLIGDSRHPGDGVDRFSVVGYGASLTDLRHRDGQYSGVEILQNVERLEGISLTIYQTYPEAAYDTLKKIECLWPIADITLQHRECYDGSGFPRSIRGDDILIEARILAVAVAVEDLTTHRSYRNAFPLSEVLEKLSSHSGTKYDLDVVAACLKLLREKGCKMES